jgi:hypothetical protein
VSFKIFRDTENVCWLGCPPPNPLLENLAPCKKMLLLQYSIVNATEWPCEKMKKSRHDPASGRKVRGHRMLLRCSCPFLKLANEIKTIRKEIECRRAVWSDSKTPAANIHVRLASSPSFPNIWLGYSKKMMPPAMSSFYVLQSKNLVGDECLRRHSNKSLLMIRSFRCSSRKWSSKPTHGLDPKLTMRFFDVCCSSLYRV